MTSYQTLRAKIAELEKQAEALRKDELKSVVGQIRKAIAEFGLTAADLGLGGGRARKAGVAPRPRGRLSVGLPKYRHPETGATWTGHGRPPTWIVEAADRETYRIGASASSSKAAAKKKSKAAGKPAAKARKTAAAKPAGKKASAGKKAAAKRAAPGRKRAAPAKSAPAQADAGAAAV